MCMPHNHTLIFRCSTFKWTMCKLKIISCKSAHKSVQGVNEQTAALINGFSTDTLHLMQSICLNLLCVGWKRCTYDMLCKNNPSKILCATLEHACVRYANDHQTHPLSENNGNSNVYFSKIQPLLQSFSGNESNRSPWVEEIAFPELHFTAWCWIHSSGNSFWMFHHRLDPRGWYNPLITRTHRHVQMHTFASCMWGIWESIICWGSDLIAYSMWEDTNMIECQARQLQSLWYVRISSEVPNYHFSSSYAEESKIPFSCGHVNVLTSSWLQLRW